ncbi:hypothetical protein MMYC01_204726 [Madurella mycetomatis]|uniref:Uncharacterized protein n=1 Tax=Madurella mycetomatis TaxID=100816 RepID=A0A175W7K7_9PEZI|nr:hypothetical protein MMYC01_204726 [Madurella mycetomatis]
MGQYRPWFSSQGFALLFVMASTASALSLSSFEPIVPNTVPISCILAYNNDIPGCTIDDFMQGSSCSARCIRGLADVQRNVQAVCNGVDVPLTTVLGQVLAGNLRELLCPSAPPVSSSIRPPTTLSTSTTATPTEDPVVSTTSTPDSLLPSPGQSSASTSPASSSTPSASPEPAPDTDESGGGSPFDIPRRGDSRRLTPRWGEAALVGLALGLILAL